jgi:hypothetical protein
MTVRSELGKEARLGAPGEGGCERQDARRDGRAERRETEAYLKQYVEITRGEPTRMAAETCSHACRSGVSAVVAV